MRSTGTERTKIFRARKSLSGFVRFQPVITRYSHQHLTQLCKAYGLTQAEMIAKIINDNVANTQPSLDYHYSLGFIKLDLWLKSELKSLFKTYVYAGQGACMAAWILAYPLP